MADLHLSLLGGFDVRCASGRPGAPVTKKARALLAYLALSPGRLHSRDKLAALLWEDSDAVQARTSLRQALAALRRTLPADDGGPFVADGDALALGPDAVEVDAVAFERLAAEGTADALERAVELYRGDLLEGFHLRAPAFEDWLAPERERLRELALGAMARLLAHEIEAGAVERGIRVAARLLALDPLQEEAHRALMRLYARQGRLASALRQYRVCRDVLRRELGVPPEPETDRLYREILRRRRGQDGAGDAPAEDEGGDGADGDEQAAPLGVDAEAAAPAAAEREEPGVAAGQRPTAELRQATVLFADLSGFTELSGELDPEELHGLLGAYFGAVDEIVQDHGGRVDKHIGDSVMAVFGAPVARGNDPERAVRAALAVHDAMPGVSEAAGRPLRVHVGVASGQVVASGIGGTGYREYTVTGPSVNLAARLTDEAGPGETFVSDAVRRVLADRIEAEEVGDLAIKGIAQPVRVWRARGLREPGDGDGAAPGHRRPFVGRRAELHQFEGALAACREAGEGQAVHVRGEAGIGKTRLVEEFKRVAAGQGFDCHTGLVLDFGAGKGRDAIRALVRSLLGVPQGGDKALRRAALDRALADGLLAPEQRVYLNDLLDLPQPPALRGTYDAMDNATRNRRKREAVADLVCRLSGRRPLLLAIEDVHWADRPTLDSLAALAATVAECPAVLVMTSRVEDDPLDAAWRAQAGGAPLMTIDLAPLRRRDAAALAAQLAGGRDDPFAAACVERAGGNPLFLEQLLRGPGGADEAGVVPDSVQSLVLARMDRLDPADRAALQAASVLGQRFALPVLRHLVGDPGHACGALWREGLVRPEGDEEYLFGHALVQEAVYASLLKSTRRELHRRAAAWFAGRDPVLHAEHLDRAEDPAAPAAYLAAARAQAAAYRDERALALVERGLELATARADRYALTRLRGEVLHDLGEIAASTESFERALAEAQDDAERCPAWIGLADGMRVTDDYDRAFDALAKAEAAATGHGLVPELGRVHHLRGNLYFPLGRLEGCLREHEAALECARRAGSAELEARALGGLGDAEYARGRMRTAHGYFQRCIELCRRHGFGRIEVTNVYMVAGTRIYTDGPRAALGDCLAAIEAAVRVGHHRAELLARIVTMNALFEMADLAAKREHAERSRALVRHLGAWRFEAEQLVYSADILRAEGRRAEALELLDEALRISRDTGVGYLGPTVLGVIALAAEDPAARRRALEEGEAILRAGAVSHNHFWFYRDAIQASLDAGAWDDAERYASALEDYTRPEPLPWSDFYIARGRALAAHGRGAQSGGTARELERLRREAGRLGLRAALPPIEAALAGAG